LSFIASSTHSCSLVLHANGKIWLKLKKIRFFAFFKIMIFANPAFVENLEMSVNLAAICNVSKKISPMLSLFEQGNCQN